MDLEFIKSDGEPFISDYVNDDQPEIVEEVTQEEPVKEDPVVESQEGSGPPSKELKRRRTYLGY